MKHISIKSLIMLSIVGLTFTSCKKEEQKEVINVESSAKGIAKNDIISADIFGQVNVISRSHAELMSAEASGKVTEGFGDDILDNLSDYSCAKVNITPLIGWPKTVTLDFGDGCSDPKTQKVRKGKITLVYSAAWLTLGGSVKVSFENYWCGDTQFDGYCEIKSSGLVKIGEHKFTMVCEGTKIHCGCVEQWSCHKEVVWCNNGTVLNALDDYYKITGLGEGSDDKGNYFSEKITKPLIKKVFCHWIGEGTIEMKTNSVSLATLDYGAGDCDDDATLTVNGQAKPIDL